MALEKEVEYKGYTYKYWVVSDTLAHKDNNETQIIVHCYKDKEQRDLDLKNRISGLTKYYTSSGMIGVSDSYAYLKTTDFFKDAKDA